MRPVSRLTLTALALALAAFSLLAPARAGAPDTPAAAPAGPPGAAAAFERLKTLAGDWVGKDADGNLVPISYTIVSNGSAVLESMGKHGEGDMVTIYHRDGDGLMLTHYCSIGNQPRLRMTSGSPDGSSLTFTFVDATNLKHPGDAHISGLTVTFVDADHFSQGWSSTESGKETSFKATYERKK